jgi:dolichol-phosphate mannosyltransferase
MSERMGGIQSSNMALHEETVREYDTSQLAREISSTAAKSKVSVIIPVYNEESKISSLIKKVTEILEMILLDYEVIVINDGSIDNTAKVIEEKLDERVKVLSYDRNRGKGYAVRAGILESEGDIVIFMDGDLDISPCEIQNYLNLLEDHDLIIASKAHPLSTVIAPASRKLLSKVFSFLVRLIVGLKIKDTQCGLKVGNGSLLRRIFEVMLVDRYAFDVELLSIATRLNLEIAEIPIRITLESSFKIRDVARMFLDILAISYRLKTARWYQSKVQSIILKKGEEHTST